MTHTTTWEPNGIYWDIFGTLDSKEVIEFNEELSDYPGLEKMSYFIWDSTKVKKINADQDDANLSAMFGNLLSQYNKNVKGAFVINDSTLKILVQTYIQESKKMESTWVFMMFENRDEARKWVSL